MIGYSLGSERITSAALWVEGAEAEARGLVGGLVSGGGRHLTGLQFASLVPAHGMWRKGREVLLGAGPSPPGAGGAQSAWTVPREATAYLFGFGHGERLEASWGDEG